MAYFPNGASGDVLDAQCAKCLPSDPCPIWFVQTEYNYEQLNPGNERMRELINYLVDEKGQCKMKRYVKHRAPGTPRTDHKSLQRKLIFGDKEQIAALNGET
jgi:hypothetical protein